MSQITKVHLTKVYASDKDKEGKPLMSKSGRPYTKLAIKTSEYGDKWLSGFQGKENMNWKEGDEVEIIVKQNGDYLNFDTPKAEDKLSSRIDAMQVDILNLKNAVARLSGVLTAPVQPQQVAKQVSGPDDFGGAEASNEEGYPF